MTWCAAGVRNLTVAILVGGIMFAGMNGKDFPRGCADGWRSPSIGSVGACSHHGGVVSGIRFVPWWKQVLPFAAGALIFIIPTWRAGAFRRSAPLEPVLASIVRAIDEGRAIRFLYTKPGGGAEWRTVTPIELSHVGTNKASPSCLVAYCHKRQGRRTFMLSRISAATLSIIEA
ncbi:helix-turn-helix transcriptional regulator [Stenotrophomonas maltophilia]|uniref:helix-turn-helix transcriptional regulator n=1 Tax=Stenotrophomonas maltophilia TaxID=40324 RepID=UPI003D18AAFC